MGFTGSQTLLPEDENLIARTLRIPSLLLDQYNAFVTGACIGVDTYVGKLLAGWFPNAQHVVVVPANRTKVDKDYLKWASHIINMPPETNYRDRNTTLVKLSNKLVAFPRHTEHDSRSKHSGTWQTVRIARRHGVTYKVFVLDQPPTREVGRDQGGDTIVSAEGLQ